MTVYWTVSMFVSMSVGRTKVCRHSWYKSAAHVSDSVFSQLFSIYHSLLFPSSTADYNFLSLMYFISINWCLSCLLPSQHCQYVCEWEARSSELWRFILHDCSSELTTCMSWVTACKYSNVRRELILNFSCTLPEQIVERVSFSLHLSS